MPNELQSIISQLDTLFNRLSAKSSEIERLSGYKQTSQTLELRLLGGRIAEEERELTILNASIDISRENLRQPGLDADIREKVERGLARDEQKAKNRTRVANKLISEANRLLAKSNVIANKEKTDPLKEEPPKKPAKPKPSAQKTPPKPAEVQKLANDRTKLVNDIIAKMEKAVGKSQDEMRAMIEDFVDKLDVDESGNVKNTLANKRKISLLDNVYQRYVQDSGVKVVDTIVKGVSDVLDFNGKYYGVFTTKAQLGNIMTDTRSQIGDWLGITKRGGLVENGYLNRLLNDQTIRNTVRDSVFKSVVGQKGFFEVKKDLKNYIAGNPEKAGALQQYYRNFVYDTFSQVDRTQAKIFADKLGFQYAIFEGHRLKTSRAWCIARKGKVFTREEIEKFNPPTAKPPNYNPFTDLGGFGCVDHLNWVPETVAFALRPELRNK